MRRIFENHVLSLETLDSHQLVHNDIKPQNYLVKFLNGPNDLTQIDIGLTDFGLAGSDQKGGTPIFASPECLADSDRKDKSTDIFSLGRVFLFSILPKEKFLQFLFVSLIKGGKNEILKLIEKEPILHLISKMMRIQNRIGLQTIRQELQSANQIVNTGIINKISEIIRFSTSEDSNRYIEILKHFS